MCGYVQRALGTARVWSVVVKEQPILPLLSYPSKYHKELRLIVIFWLINEHIDTRIFLDRKEQPLPSIQKRINTIINSDNDFESPCKNAKLQPKVGDEVDIYTCIRNCSF